MKQPLLIRIHVPFVSRKPSFYPAEPALTEGHDTKLLRDYVIALANELRANAPDYENCQVTAIRLDGGSASIVDGADLERLLRLLREWYDVSPDVRISLRACPADINGANVPFYNRAAIGRYDLELYSLEPQDFATVDTLNYMDALPYIGMGFLHADRRNSMGFILLYGKRTRAKYGFLHSLMETIRRPVAHVILQRCAGADAMTDAEAQTELALAAERLTQAGFREYLPQHWAKPGCEDPVLLAAAQGHPVLGIGAGASTRMDGVLSTNTSDLNLYLANSARFDKIVVSAEKLGE